MSSHPSLFTSATVAPLHHELSAVTCDASVISSNSRLPLFKYNLLLTWLAVKYKSCRPSLLKSPTATPPPLYKNSKSIGLTESFSVILLLNVILVCDEDSLVKSVLRLLQAKKKVQIKKSRRTCFI